MSGKLVQKKQIIVALVVVTALVCWLVFDLGAYLEFERLKAQIDEIEFRRMGGPHLQPGEGPLAFGGVNWHAWRVEAEVRDDKLVTLPRVRPGFRYGHGGNGRSATLVTNVGNKDWTDYRVEMDVVVSGKTSKLLSMMMATK